MVGGISINDQVAALNSGIISRFFLKKLAVVFVVKLEPLASRRRDGKGLAWKVFGWGVENIIPVTVQGNFRLKIDCLI